MKRMRMHILKLRNGGDLLHIYFAELLKQGRKDIIYLGVNGEHLCKDTSLLRPP